MSEDHDGHIPSPDYSHLDSTDFERVYEPSEDTFILLDALQSERHHLATQRPLICVEIGSGSGLVLAFLARLLSKQEQLVCIATDINECAAQATRKTLERNRVVGDVIVTDLLTSLSTRLSALVDILLFNPPYVVTECVPGSRGLESAWAGGERGRHVMDRVLPEVDRLLSPGGVFYLVVIEENDPDEISSLLETRGLTVKRILSRRAGRERLVVLKASKLRDFYHNYLTN